MEQRICIKFCVKNEIKCADTFRMLTVAYGEATLDKSNVYRWYKMFAEGREDVNDEKRAGRPSTSKTDEKINEVEKVMLANRRITVREVAEDLNISIGSCHSIFINDLDMRRVAAKLMTSSIVQYVIVRGDLLHKMNWPTGAIIAQACHACSAVTHIFHDDEHTKQYLADLDNMHKVVLEAPSEDSLKQLETKLKENNIKHKLWIEQPENIPTCLVLKPYPKQDVQGYMKKFKLFK